MKTFLLCLLVISSWGLPAWAQAPAWTQIAVPQPAGGSIIRAAATDANGNVFVVGAFNYQLTLGTTVLTSRGASDLFVAKYVPSTGTWAWAARGGGVGGDAGSGIAVNGNNIYVTGSIENSSLDVDVVTFGNSGSAPGTATQYGATATAGQDILVAKYIDNGSSATLAWTQVGGGTWDDVGFGIAASGNSVYVTGWITNNLANMNGVLFGGSGTASGLLAQAGASTNTNSDMVVVKYTDNGATATVRWTQVGGGTSTDFGRAIAVSGNNVYVTGALINNSANSNVALFGGSGLVAGTARQAGATASNSYDLFVAKYLDNGSSATLGWTQIGGGTDSDVSYGIAANGNNIYVTGYLVNTKTNAQDVRFGGSGATVGTSQQFGASAVARPDLVVAKYFDNGLSATLAWTQVAGGTESDFGQAIAVSNSAIYVTGFITNNTTNNNAVTFGGSGTAPGTLAQVGVSATTSNDLVVAKYTDNGNSASYNWSQVGGGSDSDSGTGLAVSGQQVYVTGNATLPVAFGNLAVATPAGTGVGLLAQLNDPAIILLPTRPASSSAGLLLFPNPSSANSYFTVQNAASGAAVQVFDVLGRVIITSKVDITGNAQLALPTAMPKGIYLVHIGYQISRLVVE